MATYMLLLYAEDADEATQAARWAELPEWDALTAELRERAVWIANAALHPVEAATTVRVRDGATAVTDGPYAVTKEMLGGFYLIDCEDLDEALAIAARMPMARPGWPSRSTRRRGRTPRSPTTGSGCCSPAATRPWTRPPGSRSPCGRWVGWTRPRSRARSWSRSRPWPGG